MTAPLPETALTDEVQARIKNVVCEVLDIEPEDLTPNGSFTQHYGADSMSIVALGASLERTFDVDIEEEILDRIDDLDSAFEVVGEALTTRP
jgi:acyl carrier protein